MKVFIQNEAGSTQKHYHDEKTLQWKSVTTVAHAYPFPYGFVIGTTAADGCNVDCFVITKQTLRVECIVDCEPAGLMEQFEDGEVDHNVLAVFPDEKAEIDAQVKDALSEHVLACFRHISGKQVTIGEFLGPEAAIAHVAAHGDVG